jgi:hypothetical protein
LVFFWTGMALQNPIALAESLTHPNRFKFAPRKSAVISGIRIATQKKEKHAVRRTPTTRSSPLNGHAKRHRQPVITQQQRSR